MSRVSTQIESSDNYRNHPAFSQQYTSFYYTRLAQLQPHISIPTAWSDSAKPVSRILDIEQNQLCWVSGTITREAAAKPNIMDDLKKMYHGQEPQSVTKYCTPNDHIFIEDDYGRIEIVGQLPRSDLLVTGIVVTLLGSQNSKGEFEVADVAYPDLPMQPARISPSTVKKIAIVSGLLLDEVLGEPSGLQLLIEYLAEHHEISRLIICGNSLSHPAEKLVGARMIRPPETVTNLEEFDRLLSSLAMLLPVHVMPGESDPTTVAFPQTPIHPAILQRSRSMLESHALVLETNPQRFEIESTVLLGSSGQPLSDLAKYTDEADDVADDATDDISDESLDLRLLYKTLQWRHMAPTAPDTLSSYPYVDDDPLVLSELPHVYFSGNSQRFSTSVKDNVRLICVPGFRHTNEFVILNLENLDAELISLEV